jgi:hypothetical protein
VEEPETMFGVPVPWGKMRKVRRATRLTTYEGNRVYNCRPFDWFPDPRVTVTNFQKGEFCGHYSEVGWNTILKRAEAGQYYNIDQAKRTKMGSWMRDRGSAKLIIPNADQSELGLGKNNAGKNIDGTDFCGILEMVIELVPADWGLGASKYPEKWVFTTVNAEVIVSAQPLGLYHNKFPYDVLEHEIEGYSLSKRSMLEVTKPLTDVITWLFNSHFYNVRKVLNDQFIVDPSRVVMKDLQDPRPGKMIRLKPSAYGSDPAMAVKQLQVVDVTQNNLGDIKFVSEILQRMTGISDGLMGALAPGRKTATEVRQSSSSGVNRLKTTSEYYSAIGWSPHAQKLLQNTQQFYDQQKQFRLAGDLIKGQSAFVDVSPEAIAGFYDYLPVDGTMPIDRFAQATLWREMMRELSVVPAIAQQYDFGQIFTWVAQLAGLKNVSRFKVQIRPDEQLQQQAAAGNVIPLRAGGSSGESTSPSGVSQLPGLGPTG